jgi:hypothetical protein
VQPGRIILNLALLFFLMRLWPLGGRGASEAATVTVTAPYSEFMRQVNANEVKAVSVDGVHLTYTLRPPFEERQRNQLPIPSQPPSSDGTPAVPVKISFNTVRPADASTPYALMQKKEIQFSAVEKRNNRMFTILVRALPKKRNSYNMHEITTVAHCFYQRKLAWHDSGQQLRAE